MGVVDANTAGFVHGGTVLRLVDEVAGLAAIKHSRRRVVTAGVDRMAFLHPVHVGELLRLTASVNAAWRTSMEVGVRVESEDPYTGRTQHTSSAYLTMVAVGEDGRPAEVPALVPETADERRRALEAEVRRRNRLAERDELIEARES
jgi:acyl-CoA hydrolase